MLFQYAGLAPNSVRLFQLHASSTVHNINLTISHHSLTSLPAFTAILPSSTEKRDFIKLNGRARTVSANAHEILTRLVQSDAEREKFFWLEEACVDANSEEEKVGVDKLKDKVCESAERILRGVEEDVVKARH